MKIVQTYINNMGIDISNPNKTTFADRWGLTSLQKLGHEVTLICGSNENKRKEYTWKGIKVIELPIKFQATTSSRILKGLIKELNKIEADVFHTHHYCSLIPEITAIIGKKRKIPTFITMHVNFQSQHGLPGLLERFYSYFIMQPILPLFTKAFFISDYYIQNKNFRFMPKSKKTVIYNYFPKPKKLNLKRKEKTLLYVGRLIYLKGPDLLIKSLPYVKKIIPDIKVNMVGDGEDTEKIKTLAKKLNVYDNIKFHGALYGNEKWKQYYLNSIFIFTTRYQGMCNTSMEALMCEMPIIVSNKWALPEGMRDEDYIFKRENPKDLAIKIVKLIKNKEKQRKIIKQAKKLVPQYNKDTIGKRLIEEYKK